MTTKNLFSFFNEKEQCGVDYNILENVLDWEKYSSLQSANDDLPKLNLNSDDVFLDIGCGLGYHLKQALTICKFAYGLDPAVEMISKTESILNREKKYNLMNKGILEVEKSDFSIVPNKMFSKMLLHHLPDFWKFVALNKLHRMVDSGCLFILADTCWCFKPQDYSRYLNEFIKVVEQTHGDKIAEHVEQNISEEFSTFDFVLENLITKSGFKIINKDIAKTKCFVEYTLIK